MRVRVAVRLGPVPGRPVAPPAGGVAAMEGADIVAEVQAGSPRDALAAIDPWLAGLIERLRR